MKRFYTIVLATLFVGGFAVAQNGKSPVLQNSMLKDSRFDDRPSRTKPLNTSAINSTEKAVIWSNTCSNAGDWVFTNNSAPTPTNWAIETAATYPAGIQSGTPFNEFLSSSASDGYLFICSDCIGGSDLDGTPNEVFATTATPIDLTGYPAVALKFSHNYRWWQDTREVRVSGDNGATWTNFYMTDAAGYPGDQNSLNPQIEVIDISAIAGDSSQVLVQFYYHDNDYWGWYWYVDDVSIGELEDNDLTMLDGLWANTTGAGTPYIPYSKMPQSQLNDINFYGLVKNSGAVDQPNAVMTAIVSGAGSGSYSGAGTTVNQGSIDTLTAGPMSAAGMANGNYMVTWTVTSDSTDVNPADNTVDSIWDFEVTNSLYARDLGVYDGTYTPRDFDSDGLTDPVEFFLDYQFYNPDTIMSLSAVFPIDNTVGQELLYNIYDPSGAAVYDGVSAPVPTYTLTAADLTAGAGSEVWVDLPFIDPMTGAPGFPIDPALGEVWTFSIRNEFDTLYVGVSGEALADGGVWTTAGVSWYPLDGSNQNYYTTNCFMMRLNLAASSTGVSETELDAVLGQNRPNPFNDNTIIPFTLRKSGNVAFMVTDVTGKVIENRNLGVLGAGSQTIEFNGSELASGIYYYTLNVDGKRSTKKFVVE